MSDTPKDPENQSDETGRPDEAARDEDDAAGAGDRAEGTGDEAPEAVAAVREEEEEDGPRPSEQLDEALASSSLISSGEGQGGDGAQAETANAQHDAGYAEHGEEASGSLAGRVLTWLVILIAGGVLALWGGPKIAPYLPAGLAPVAAWLTPGSDAAMAEIAALREEVDTRLDELPAPADPGDLTAEAVAAAENAVAERIGAVEESLAALEGEVNAEIAELSEIADQLGDRLAALQNAELPSRLSQVETRLSGLVSQVETLSQMEPAEGGLGEGAREQLSQFQATVDGLEAEIAALAAADGELAERIESVIATTERRIEQATESFRSEVEAAQAQVAEAEAEVAEAEAERAETERAAEIRANATAIEAAIANGTPYADSLEALSGATDAEVPAVLAENAGDGVSTLSELRARFSEAAYDALRADIRGRAEGNVVDRLGAFLESQIATRSLTPQEGESTDAILSRAEASLDAGDLAAAVTELGGLEGAAAEAMSGWIADAEARLGAADALASFREAALATN